MRTGFKVRGRKLVADGERPGIWTTRENADQIHPQRFINVPPPDGLTYRPGPPQMHSDGAIVQLDWVLQSNTAEAFTDSDTQQSVRNYERRPAPRSFLSPINLQIIAPPITKLLMHMDSLPFTDSSASAHAFTLVGSPQVDGSNPKFGLAAALFNGAGDCMTTPDSTDFTLGTNDFTLEAWFICTAAGGTKQVIAGQADSGGSAASTSIGLRRNTNNFLQGNIGQGGTVNFVLGTTNLTTLTGWHHAALVRFGNIFRIFLDGVQDSPDTVLTGPINDSSNLFAIGRHGEQLGGEWTGSLDEVRFTNGLARWVSNFTLPDGPYSPLG